MAVPRNKGHFVQAGSIILYPTVSGSVVSHDGTLPMDSVHLQTDYPFLFQVIGTDFNDPGKGDDPATQFRTPLDPGAPAGYEYRIRF